MPHSTLQLCLPGLLAVGALLVVLRLLLAASGGRLDLGRLQRLHTNQTGSVQSLSFVITLPLFILILSGIVQISQLMIARIFVEYSAVAAARSAIVWIPAHISGIAEGRNIIQNLVLDEEQDPTSGGTYYRVVGGSTKAFRIQMAAAQALVPIAPARDTVAGADRGHPGLIAYDSFVKAYQALATGDSDSDAAARRLANKLAYALNNTKVDVRIFHPASEPELATYLIPDDLGEFYLNEIGWQDSITVTVTHRVALLPGPGRLFARIFSEPDAQGETATSPLVEQSGDYLWPLTATATLGNEGQKPLIRYDHQSNGKPL